MNNLQGFRNSQAHVTCAVSRLDIGSYKLALEDSFADKSLIFGISNMFVHNACVFDF